MCIEILASPASAIAKARKQKRMNKTVSVLLITCVLFGVSAGIGTLKFSLAGIGAGAMTIMGFLVALIVILLTGLLIELAARTLGGKGKYFEGLTTVTYSFLIPSVGLLIASVLLFIPLIGPGLAFLALVVSVVMGFAMLYRSTKDLFRIDMITSFIVISVVIAAFLLAAYGIALFSLIGRMTMFAGLV